MKNRDLSVIIAGRNEEFLARTIKDVLDKKRANTEVIVILDGVWAEPPIEDNPDVTIIYHPVSVGQRKAVNDGVKLSNAKYVMKLDAHCILDEGFDVKLMADCQHDWTVIPRMYNLHAFDWVCDKCGYRKYQSPTPEICEKCKAKGMRREIIWKPRLHKRSDYMRFDSDLHFQYYGEYKNSKEAIDGMIVGYNLSFDIRNISLSIINLLTSFANSHQLTCSSNFDWFRQNVSSNTMCFPSVNNSGSIGTIDILSISNKSEVNRVTATPIITDMVNNRNILSPTTRNTTDKPSIENSVCECFLTEIGTPSVIPSVNSTNPIPTSRRTINSNIIKKFNDILGGEFVYSEKTNSFHNGSVTLITVHDNGLAEIMSFVGACFFMERLRYWELEGLDEEHGSWGQMGTEIACKSWLSGGKLMVNKKTWFSHLFRTQGGDFSFPYPQSGKQVEHAKQYSQDLWKNNKWKKAIHDLDWLIKKFTPIPGWSNNQVTSVTTVTPTKGIIYYTDNKLKVKISKIVKRNILRMGLPIVSASLKPMDFGTNLCIPMQRGYEAYFTQILKALEASTADIIFFCEHDTLYHSSHFDFIPKDKNTYYYDDNFWRIRISDGHAIHYDTDQVNLICAYRELLLQHYRKHLEMLKRGVSVMRMGFEPGTHSREERIDDFKSQRYHAKYPSLDLRHDTNLTRSKWKQSDFRSQRNCRGWIEKEINDEIPGWGKIRDIIKHL